MVLDTVLAALYLRGASRTAAVRRRGWPLAERAIRRSSAELGGTAEALREAGLWAEALALEEPGLLSWAEGVVEAGRCLTAASVEYPERWIRRLGEAAPPALWREGPLPPGPLLGVVGSRQVEESVLSFAEGVASEGVRLGYGIVSGGAKGCDSAAARGTHHAGGTVLEILPCGLEMKAGDSATRLSVSGPTEPFSAGAAMERNALLYAVSERTVVVHARFKAGGTWAGATDALRRRLCPLIARDDPDDLAHRSLLSLGATPLQKPADLEEAFLHEEVQEALAM